LECCGVWDEGSTLRNE
jgi:hypothetical protein